MQHVLGTCDRSLSFSEPSLTMPTILIVEDEEHLAVGIKFNLEAEGYCVLTAADGPAALLFIAEAQPAPDLVILDLMLPGMSGYAVCESIRSDANQVPILMLTARTLVEDRIRGFDAGTDVYLQKPFDLNELLSVVRNLLQRSKRVPSEIDSSSALEKQEIRRFGSTEINFDSWEVRVNSQLVKLTALEMKLLRYLIEHEGSVVSRAELLERVWGMRHASSTRTVDTFMHNLRRYFEKDPSKPVHFVSVRGMGYRFVYDSASAQEPEPS